jgi:glutaminyl-peptide cyclotransferase
VALTAIAALAAVVAGCAPAPAQYRPSAPNQLRAEVVQRIPHDPRAFTEGLELADGVLYEGTGLEGASTIRAVDPTTGAVRQQAKLPDELFGEGITVLGQTIWQLTYRQGIAIQRDRGTFAELGRASFSGEGWGLCHDGNRLIMSDGTDRLAFRDPQTFQQTGEIHVTSGGRPVTQLNELECVQGAVFANIWQTDTIVRIDPASGAVTADVDLAGLLPADQRAGVDVLNGIAAVPGTDEFLVTGKYWPTMFRVRFVSAAT